MKSWKRRTIGTLAVFLVLSVAGVAFAAWTADGSGSGQAKATTMSGVTATVGTVTGDLFPGGTGDVKLTFANGNSFPVKVTAVVADGAVTASGGAGTCSTTGVSFGAQSGLTLAVAASGTLAHTFTGAASMDNTSDSGCQGATFTIPVKITAISAP